MTPSDEMHLYRTDYQAWCRYVAPHWRDLLLDAKTAEEKKVIWSKATPELQTEIRALREDLRRAA